MGTAGCQSSAVVQVRSICIVAKSYFTLNLTDINMFVVTGDETGVVKLVDVTGRTYLRYGDVQSRANSVSAIVSSGKKSVVSVKLNGELDHYTIDVQEDSTQLLLEKTVRTDVERPTGLKRIILNGTYSDKMLIYNAQGAVSVYDPNAIKSSKSNLASFSVRGPLAASAMCNNGQVLFGGKENDARLYSIESQKEIWAAKNVSQDKLHLRVPVWITCMSFQSPFLDSFESESSSSVFYTGTAHRHVRMYDIKAGQKPTASLELGPDFRVASIQPARRGESDRLLYVADTAGGLTQWDMRTQRRVATMNGPSGSVREMALSENSQHMACVGLDRFLRVYDATTNKLQSAIYLKNRLNACVFVEGHIKAPEKEEKEGKSSSKKRAEGARVTNEDDEDLLHELGNSSDEEEEGEEEEVEEDASDAESNDSAADIEEDDEEEEEESESESQDEEEAQVEGSDGDEQFSSGEEEEEGSEEGSEEEGSEGSEEEDDSEGSDEEEEGSESEGEEEVVASFKWGGAAKAEPVKAAPAAATGKNNKAAAARPAAIAAPAKKARR